MLQTPRLNVACLSKEALKKQRLALVKVIYSFFLIQRNPAAAHNMKDTDKRDGEQV